MQNTKKNNDDPFLRAGGRNLLILGVGSIALSVLSTGIALAIYKNSGDIYLDRSRPGYISEDEQPKEEVNSAKGFSSEGQITSEAMHDYLQELSEAKDHLDSAQDYFSDAALSDGALGLGK